MATCGFVPNGPAWWPIGSEEVQVIVQRENGWRALHIPTGAEKSFSSFLAAKTWMLVQDSRSEMEGWRYSCVVAYAPPPTFDHQTVT